MHLYRILTTDQLVTYACADSAGKLTLVEGDFNAGFIGTDKPVEAREILAPLMPPVVFGVGLNYHAYSESSGMALPEHPLIFMKQGNAVIGLDEAIEIPTCLPSDAVDYEGELAVVIGKRCKNCTPATALSYVAGYTCANDVTARDWQFIKGAGQFSRAKTFDTFCPLGPAILLNPDFARKICRRSTPPVDAGNLTLKTWVNGELRQEASTKDLIFSIPQLITFLSGSTTLMPGTVILTGTPSGIGHHFTPPKYLKDHDVVEVEISGIGRLRNPVIRE